MGQERREFLRLDVSFIVVCKVNAPIEVSMMVGGREVHAIMSNLSEGGMAILTNYNLPVSTVVTAEFILVNDDAEKEEDRVRSIRISGDVRYNSQVQEKTFRLGVRFTDISENDRRFIGEFIKAVSRRSNKLTFFLRRLFRRPTLPLP